MTARRPLVAVVEDDPDFRAVVRDWLAAGYDVLEAGGPEDFLKLIDRRRPDLVVLDLRLPEPAGAGLTRVLRGHPRLEDVPVLLLTASAWDNDFVEALEAGVDAYLPKPVDRADFLGKVAQLVSK